MPTCDRVAIYEWRDVFNRARIVQVPLLPGMEPSATVHRRGVDLALVRVLSADDPDVTTDLEPSRRSYFAALDTLSRRLKHLREENAALHGSLGETRRRLYETQGQLLRSNEQVETLTVQLAEALSQLPDRTVTRVLQGAA